MYFLVFLIFTNMFVTVGDFSVFILNFGANYILGKNPKFKSLAEIT